MPLIMPIKELRNTTEISNIAHKEQEPIFITKNGKSIARLTSPAVNKLALLDGLVGIVLEDQTMDENTIREERLSRQ